MPAVSLHSSTLITRLPALRQVVARLAHEPLLAVDTESNSLYVYQERVCMIQFSTPHEDLLVDPLALDDLSPLGLLFAEEKIEKIFHAVEYDLITLKRDFGFTFTNLFDTMLAARILGWNEVGLGSILKAEFGVELNKRYQRADWGRRPLPADMLDYARQDTHYLIPLRYRLKAELKSSGRWPIAQEDFNRMCHVNGRDPEDSPEPCWRIRGAMELPPEKVAVLQELCHYREQVARTIDRPVFKVIGDQTLLAVAEACPRNQKALQNLDNLSRKQYQRHAEALLRAVQRGLQAGPLYPPRSTRPDEGYMARLEALREWRKRVGAQMKVPSDVVLPRDLLHTLASTSPINSEVLAKVMAQVPWRLEHFGDQILNILSTT